MAKVKRGVFRTASGGSIGGNSKQRAYIKKQLEKSKALETKNKREQERVGELIPALYRIYGERKVTRMLNDLDKKGFRFVDVVTAIENRISCGRYADDMPQMDFFKNK